MVVLDELGVHVMRQNEVEGEKVAIDAVGGDGGVERIPGDPLGPGWRDYL